MSLLIKALDKAEKDQAKNSNAGKIEPSELSADWSLETIDEVPSSESHQVSSADANRNEIGLAGYIDSTLLSANQSHLADNRSTLSHNRTSKIQSQQAHTVGGYTSVTRLLAQYLGKKCTRRRFTLGEITS